MSAASPSRPTRLTRRVFPLAAIALAVAARAALAQGTYPDKPITLVVPNAAGGAADNLARSFAEEMSRRLRQSVVVENQGGASGAIAAQKVLRAAPDGSTLLFGTTSDVVINPIVTRSAGYAARDFTAIAKVGVTPMTLVARPNLGVSTPDQLVAMAKQKPNGLSVGTTGSASLQAFATVAVQKAGGIDLLGVPYKGGAPIVTDLLGGTLDLAVITLPGALAQVRAGKMNMVGLLSDKRNAAAPDLPTINEGRAIKGVSVEIWAGLLGPAGLPPAVVERLSRVSQDILGDKDYNERRAKSGDGAVPWQSAAEFGQFLRAEDDRYRALATGMKFE